jgi:hypothetical protein
MAEEFKVEQRTDAWLAKKAGKISASRAKDVMAFSKKNGAVLKARIDYAIELAYERLSGKSRGIPMSATMQWGVDVEPAARCAYEARVGIMVQSSGFDILEDGSIIKEEELIDINWLGCSPDGLVGEGGIEIKCPYNPTVHALTWLNGMPEEHIPQVQFSMMIKKAPWWDFVSYDPRAPEAGRLYIQRIERDEEYIKDMAYHCQTLNDEVNELVDKLKAMWKI